MNRLCPKAEERQGVSYTLGGILRSFATTVLPELKLGARPRRVLGLLAACGTPQLGFTLYQCPHCHGRHGIARSCGDRHCPRCLAAKSRQWLAQQTRSLLPLTYYHCILTLPEELNPLVLLNPARLYPLLFEAAAQSLLQFGRNRLQGDLGISAVLHTWGQQLNFHPHLHCIVTGGALSRDGRRWRSPKQRKFLFPVKALSALFRGKFLDGLKTMLQGQSTLRLPDPSLGDPQLRQCWLSKLYAQKWVVYAKRPFGGPEQVLNYLANYTHRVALSNRRIVAVNEQEQTVTFTWRDYRQNGTVKALTLGAREFLRLSREGRLACDVWLVHLTGEEFPSDCMGARNFCENLVQKTLKMRKTGDAWQDLSAVEISGVLVMDMIAHNRDNGRNIFQISPGRTGEALKLAFQAHKANEAWNYHAKELNKLPDRKGCSHGTRVSDRESIPAKALHLMPKGEIRTWDDPYSSLYNTDGMIFSDTGIPVILFMENYDINRTGYHDTHDTMENIDLDYGAAISSIAIETLARLACSV